MKLILLFYLFGSFNASIYYIYKYQINRNFVLLLLIIFLNNYWLISSRIKMVMNMFISVLYNEFPLSMYYKSSISNITLFK